MTRVTLAYNNVYAVDHGGERVLIDAGPDYEGAFEELSAALDGWHPSLIVATHAHLDHAGLASQWQEAGTPVGLLAPDAQLTQNPSLAAQAELDAYTSYLAGCGAPPDVAAEAETALKRRRAAARLAASSEQYPEAARGSRWPTSLRYRPFHAARILREGVLPGTSLRVIASPGHTPGNVVIHDEADGSLYSGDQLLPDITPTPAIQFTLDEAGHFVRFKSLPAFSASLRRLRGMDFRRCFPGHGEPFDDVTHAVEENLANIAQRSEKVLRHLAAGAPASVYSLAEALYPRALKRGFWQIVATTQGHLDLLVEEGQAAFDGHLYHRTG